MGTIESKHQPENEMNIRNEPEFQKVLLNAKRAAYAKAVKEGKSAAFLIALQKMIIASAK